MGKYEQDLGKTSFFHSGFKGILGTAGYKTAGFPPKRKEIYLTDFHTKNSAIATNKLY